MSQRLRTERSHADVSLAVGASITDLVVDGARVLWSQPSVEQPPPGTEPTMVDWVTSGGGGWEVMAPNAGAACRTPRGADHSFHGAAGRAAWTLSDRRDQGLTATVDLDDLGVSMTRTIELGTHGCRVTESMAATGSAPIPVVWGSHLGLGGVLVEGPVRIDVEGDYLRGEVDGSEVGPDDFAQVAASATTGTGALGFAAVETDVGRARLAGQGHVAMVTWDAVTFPYLWIWIELEASSWPWGRRARAIGLEPCSSWPATGITSVMATTETHVVLQPDDQLRGWVDLHVEEYA